jgi:hypothetical protein
MDACSSASAALELTLDIALFGRGKIHPPVSASAGKLLEPNMAGE